MSNKMGVLLRTSFFFADKSGSYVAKPKRTTVLVKPEAKSICVPPPGKGTLAMNACNRVAGP